EAQEAESAYLGVYRREVFETLDGFDEGIRRGQDWELNLRIRTAGGRIWLNPDMQVTYWPRGRWAKIARQSWATGSWRAELLRRAGGRIWFLPGVQVSYWPRGTWSKLARQFWATGIWRAELIRRYGAQNSLRYFAPPLLVLGMGAAVIETLLQLTGRTKTWPK